MRKGWGLRKLGDLYEITSSKRVFESEWTKQGVPFYRAREIVKLAKLGFVNNELFISEAMYKQYSQKYGIPKVGDIMVTGVGTLGICYVVQEQDKFYFKDGNIIWLKKKASINSQFIEYAFKSDFLRSQIDDSIGATVGTFTIVKAKNTLVPIPSLDEQNRIVVILNKTFAAIDKAKANTERNLQNARELFESYLQGVFENKGGDWEEKTLEDLADEKCTLSYGIVQPGDEYPNGLPIIRPTDLTGKFIKIGGLKRIDPKLADGYKRTTLTGDELFICVRGSTGIVSIATKELQGANVTRGIVPVRFNAGIINQEFGYYLLISNYIQNQIKAKTYGAALMQINIGDLRKILTPYPPLKTQRYLVQKLDSLSIKTQKLETIYQQKLNNLDQLKKSILQKAFAGELTLSTENVTA